MLSAADRQPVSSNAQSSHHISIAAGSQGVPRAWRFIVLPSRAQLQSGQAGATILRCDAPHSQSVTGPQLVWSLPVGILPHLPERVQRLLSDGLLVDDAGIARESVTPQVPFGSLSEKPSGASPDQAGDRVGEKYRALLAEAAHDIRAPLGVAQQILSRIASRVRADRSLDHNELRLLDSANDRLKQASMWCADILAPNRLEQAHTASIRQRFYPHQLLAIVAPIVTELALRRDVKLHWIGWDQSLPRLYLDSNQLARVLMNLIGNAIEASSAGSHLSVRVAWQTNVTQRLVIAIEDEGCGLDGALLKFLNSNQAASAKAGIGLATVKTLVAAMGGALSAQVVQSGGTLLRISLPVDNRLSLVRGWLVQNAASVARNQAPLSGRIQLHVLRSAGLNTRLADQLLQQSASPNDFVYRIADDRWLWLSILQSSNKSGEATSKVAISSKGAVERLSEQLTERMAVESGRLNCQLAFEWSDVDLQSLHSSLNQHNLLPQLSAAIADKFAQLGGQRIPPIDELNHEVVSEWANNRDLDSAAAQRFGERTRHAGAWRVDAADANSLATRRHREAIQPPLHQRSLTTSFLNADPLQFAELAQDWRAQQSDLLRSLE